MTKTKSRRASNLDKFNAARSEPVIPLLEFELNLCKKRRLEFDSIGLLAAYLSDRVPAHRTTLIRNDNYSKLLAAYLAKQPGAVAKLPDDTKDPGVLQAKLAAAQTEVGNLKERLKASSAQLYALTGDSRVTASGSVDFANLAMALVNVINRFPDFVRIDKERRELHDLSAKPSQRVVAGRERMGAFVQWLEANQAIPDIAAILSPRN